MMKKNIFLMCIILTSSLGWSQTYKIAYKSFSKFVDGNLEEAIQSWNKLSKEDKNKGDWLLLYSKGISWFEATEEIPIIEDKENSNEYKISTKRVINESIYKNHKENILMIDSGDIFAQFGETGNPIKKEKMIRYKWNITDQKQVLSGYDCSLATSSNKKGDKIVAWYADQIAINDGPYDVWGLPGLIVQLQIGDKLFYTATSIKQEDKNTEIPIPTGNIMNPKEFDAYVKEMTRPRTITRPDGTVVRISGGKN